jgi:hypothetical protein
MKRTTIVFDDLIYEWVKKTASKNDMAIKELVSMLLRKGLEQFVKQKISKRDPQFRSYHLGKERINLADRNELFRRMDATNKGI